MSWFILIGVSLFIGLIYFIINSIDNKYNIKEHFIGGVCISVLIFIGLIMGSAIFCAVRYEPPSINLEQFELIQEEYHPLEAIKEDKYALFNLNDQSIEFIYNQNDTIVIQNNSIEFVKIRYDKNNHNARVYIQQWQPKNWFARHFGHYKLTVYVLLLPTEENIYIGGKP